MQAESSEKPIVTILGALRSRLWTYPRQSQFFASVHNRVLLVSDGFSVPKQVGKFRPGQKNVVEITHLISFRCVTSFRVLHLHPGLVFSDLGRIAALRWSEHSPAVCP